MKIKTFSLFLVLVLLAAAGGAITTSASPPPAAPSAPNQAQGPIIVDHTCTDVTAIPQEWIKEAKRTLHIGYGHTSHGSQLTSGMSGLVGFANDGGLGLALPADIFAFDHHSNNDGATLHLFEGDGYGDGDLDHDCGYYPNWVDETRAYLGTPDTETGRGANHPDMNVIMWSWCGQASGYTEQTMLDRYLLPMTQLEQDYPGITFVYMTGHADGSGEEGNLHQRNQQIREYCLQNNKVLFDFYDIELYDPDGNYYGDKAVDDECYYDSDGDGSRDRNWALDWQDAHTQGVDWYSCGCAHSQPINCNQKAYAIWWLWARLAGWQSQAPTQPDLSPSYKAVSPAFTEAGQRVTYTVVVQSAAGPVTSTLSFHDTLPEDLIYVPGSLSASAGTVNEGDAPTLRWSGTLTPTPVVTISYAATVTYVTSGTGSLTLLVPRTITNMATITAPGYDPVTRTATLRVDWMHLYLPAVLK